VREKEIKRERDRGRARERDGEREREIDRERERERERGKYMTQIGVIPYTVRSCSTNMSVVAVCCSVLQ